MRRHACLLALAVAACSSPGDPRDEAPAETLDASTNAPAPAPVALTPTPDRRGNALARDPDDHALYVADEDHAALRIVPLPFGSAPADTLELPGRPAQVLALDDRLLVTVRDPGMLLSVIPEPNAPIGLHIAQRIPLPADAWGLAVTEDERTALVTSAWTHTVSAVDLASGETLWQADVAREPRGVVIADDRAYVTHLVGTAVTRIDGVTSDDPEITRVELPAGRFTEPLPGSIGQAPTALGASLAYAPALSPDGERLFVPRHALGGLGWATWFGRPVVDVLLTDSDSPLAPARNEGLSWGGVHKSDDFMSDDLGETLALPMMWTVQPRASVYRESTDTLLVVSEGHGRVTELDARALDPSIHPFYRYELIHDEDDQSDRCGAPSGIALSRDEAEAFVWCRTTDEIAAVALKPEGFTAGPDGEPETPRFLPIPTEPFGEPKATGRRLFYDARSDAHDNRGVSGVSGGLGCAGCHPDGRDDGHVWRERKRGGLIGGVLSVRAAIEGTTRREFLLDPEDGHPRQTPMLAGRVDPVGPYGWRGEAEQLDDRILTGFGIHRWRGNAAFTRTERYTDKHATQGEALAAFLREGLVPPPVERRPLTAVERRGEALFTLPEVGCSTCHAAEDGFANRRRYDLALSVTPLGESERPRFRTPSLLYVGGTAPYLHDGRFDSLGAFVDSIGDDMGNTSQLDADDRTALAAYLATIGVVDAAAPHEPPPVTPLPFAPRLDSSNEPDEPNAELESSWPRTVTPAPSRQEWDDADELDLRHLTNGCRVWRVREWVRVQCIPGVKSMDGYAWSWGHAKAEAQPVFRVAQIAGDRDDTTVLIEHRTDWRGEGVVIFPLRPGTRRFLEIDRRVTTEIFCAKYPFWFMAGTFMISAGWPEGADAPDLVVTRYGRHPSTGPRIVHHSCG